MEIIANYVLESKTVLSGKQLPTFQRNLLHHTSYFVLVLKTEVFLRNVSVYETTRRHIREGSDLHMIYSLEELKS
jgi:Glu-tRNA(Gln) amidotransferase subunit E-like FAD-binding protein